MTFVFKVSFEDDSQEIALQAIGSARTSGGKSHVRLGFPAQLSLLRPRLSAPCLDSSLSWTAPPKPSRLRARGFCPQGSLFISSEKTLLS